MFANMIYQWSPIFCSWNATFHGDLPTFFPGEMQFIMLNPQILPVKCNFSWQIPTFFPRFSTARWLLHQTIDLLRSSQALRFNGLHGASSDVTSQHHDPDGEDFGRDFTAITTIHQSGFEGKFIGLVVWTPLKNMKINWDDYSQYMGKKKWQPNHHPVIGLVILQDVNWFQWYFLGIYQGSWQGRLWKRFHWLWMNTIHQWFKGKSTGKAIRSWENLFNIPMDQGEGFAPKMDGFFEGKSQSNIY